MRHPVYRKHCPGRFLILGCGSFVHARPFFDRHKAKNTTQAHSHYAQKSTVHGYFLCLGQCVTSMLMILSIQRYVFFLSFEICIDVFNVDHCFDSSPCNPEANAECIRKSVYVRLPLDI